MTRNKGYRGQSRNTHSSNVTDEQLGETRNNRKKNERQKSDLDNFRFETQIGIRPPQIKFDYTDNVFSMRGNWSSNIKVIKLYFPFQVSKNKCKEFEELVRTAFKTVFLDRKDKK